MRIKVSYYFAGEPLFRQTPGGRGVWKDHTFLNNDTALGECDIWVVLDDLAEEEASRVKSGRAVLITLEPHRKREYPPAYLAQFDLVVSCHRDLPHPNVRIDHQGQTWHIGMHKGASADDPGTLGETLGYDDFVAMPPPEKTKSLSTFCSISSGLPGHRLRQTFVETLQARLGDKIDVFGRGVRPLPDKADGLIPYRYHIALENSRLHDYCTEKLSDSYLGWAFPIYWGCPNVTDYFPRDSLIEIDIDKPNEAIDIIESVMNEPLSAERMAGMAAARALVLDRYNTFDVMARACATLAPAEPRKMVIRPQREFRPSGLRRNAKRLVRKAKARLRGEVW